MKNTAGNKTKPAPRAFPVGEALVASRGVVYGIDEREGTRGVSLQSTSPSTICHFDRGHRPTRNLLQTTRDFSASVLTDSSIEMTLESALRNETAPGRTHNDPTQTKINETKPTHSVETNTPPLVGGMRRKNLQ